jgi:hypothetical protein
LLNRPFESSLFLSGCWPYLLYQKENHFLVFYKKKRVSEKQKATEHFWTSSFFISGCISCTLFGENGLAAVSSLVLKGFASTFVKNIGFEIVLLPLLCLYYLFMQKLFTHSPCILCRLYCWFWLVFFPPPSVSTVGPALPFTLAALTALSEGFFFSFAISLTPFYYRHQKIISYEYKIC